VRRLKPGFGGYGDRHRGWLRRPDALRGARVRTGAGVRGYDLLGRRRVRQRRWEQRARQHRRRRRRRQWTQLVWRELRDTEGVGGSWGVTPWRGG